MPQTKVIERISSDLEPLIERFMSNSLSDLSAMRASLKHDDFETVQRLGHNAKGSGLGYGFLVLGEIGRRIEDAAKKGDSVAVAYELDELERYLQCVEVELV